MLACKGNVGIACRSRPTYRTHIILYALLEVHFLVRTFLTYLLIHAATQLSVRFMYAILIFFLHSRH